MYLHLGQETVVKTGDIAGIFDIDTATIAKNTRTFLRRAEQAGIVENITEELPKSFVVVKTGGQTKVYITQISAATLKKRAAFVSGIRNIQ